MKEDLRHRSVSLCILSRRSSIASTLYEVCKEGGIERWPSQESVMKSNPKLFVDVARLLSQQSWTPIGYPSLTIIAF
jgi:hypothetical protein